MFRFERNIMLQKFIHLSPFLHDQLTVARIIRFGGA